MTHPMLEPLRGGLIVSCQAYPGEPMRHPETMAQVAAAVVDGGAVAVRAQGLADVQLVAGRVDVPVIGIWKDGDDGVFISPTLRHCRAVLAAGADILALDGTVRPRPDGLSFAETVRRVREESDAPIMADCDTLAAAVAAAEGGADIIGTTLAGYTDARPRTDGPDLNLLAEVVQALPGVAVVAEGRIHTPAQARAAADAGAFAVVVGTAITHPATITGWFDGALRAR
ncbi:N-acetylmannosamine-6-phosphate 2-epimerase [Occultella glacieicola]|uniref:Putative N-acetylmannosamine-6-phosphate 2-epimerase n=1 Tax=Occultella glacieicola TaxID=2518684 RepID=A0ABY2E3F8_9MICO|nr:N-acetylmannosamine-6-phosphate 2-epimerase [Occultella glacieicola]TDE94164.1 N-acetylmannosamine-6-phosphate 2-epimerase [Occultella glacieicola]